MTWRKTLPFVARIHGKYRNKNELNKVVENLTLHEELHGFQTWVNWPLEKYPRTASIIIPRACFKYKKANARGDILWLWKKISENEGKWILTGREGGFFLLHTTETSKYKPSPSPSIGSWDESRLMWLWIKYIVSLSAYKQKRGTEKRLIEDIVDIREALRVVSGLLIGTK